LPALHDSVAPHLEIIQGLEFLFFHLPPKLVLPKIAFWERKENFKNKSKQKSLKVQLKFWLPSFIFACVAV